MLNRVLDAFELAKDGRGRRAYVAWLEARAKSDGGKVDDKVMAALRRGWYLGEPTFADKLRALIAPEQAQGSGRDPVAKSHHEAEAENLVKRVFGLWGMQSDTARLEKLRKGDSRKILVAVFVRKNTSVGNRWLAKRLAMGHTAGVSRLVSGFLKDKENKKKLEDLETMLQ